MDGTPNIPLAPVQRTRGRPKKPKPEQKPKNPPHRPKVPWDGYREELQRRIEECEALPSVHQEAGYLAGWALLTGLRKSENYPPKQRTIAERMTKRFKKQVFPEIDGVDGYKKKRAEYRQKKGLLD